MNRVFRPKAKPKPKTHQHARIVARNHEDRYTIKKTGRRNLKCIDLYIRLLAASWQQLFLLFVGSFIIINAFFGAIYYAIADGIENVRLGSFRDGFFFSVQTLSTIGYGKMVPVSLAANIAVTCEVMVGIIFTAGVTGLIFSKFSRPVARVVFSNVAVINHYGGVPHLMLRVANERDNRIVDAHIQVTILRKENSPEGHVMRRLYDLDLIRDQLPMLQLSWTVMHPIDENSPIHQATLDTFKEWDAEIIVSLVGLDETFSQAVHARHSYIVEDIMFDSTFVDVVSRREEDNGIDVDLTKMHDYLPVKKTATKKSA